MNSRLIATVRRDIILNGSIRYGVARNVPAEDEAGKPCRIALVVIERESGALETVCINEARIRFHGEGIIADEVRRLVL